MSIATDTLAEIKSKGYWRILLQPKTFVANLIPSLEEAKDMIVNNKLSLRGWDYPHVDKDTTFVSEDSVESVCNWPAGPVFEYWKYFLSGQFVHYFGMREDWRITPVDAEEIKTRFHFPDDASVISFLEIFSTIYTITEIYLFASRLAQKGVLGESFHLEIQLNGVNGRTLYFSNWGRDLRTVYTCKFQNGTILLSQDIDRADIITNYAELALKEITRLFHMFGWTAVSRSLLEDEQRKFLERRL
ncbi:MAG: hypothetical protein WC897_00775 [Candidatus Gracilibacteria bacterium]